MCEQGYHGVVRCALGWACWKTYLGRPETDEALNLSMNVLGNGLYEAGQAEDALSVQEAEWSILRRIGASADRILGVQGNLAMSYEDLGRLEPALRLKRDVYFGRLMLNGEEHSDTLASASNYVVGLFTLERFEEGKSLLRKSTPVARRLLGDNNEITLRMRWIYAQSLFKDPDATLDDLREAVTMLGEIEPTTRRVLGGAHPLTSIIERELRQARNRLAAREGDDVSSVCDGVAAMTAKGA